MGDSGEELEVGSEGLEGAVIVMYIHFCYALLHVYELYASL